MLTRIFTSLFNRKEKMSREMLVNVAEEEECRIAVVENGSLEELYLERESLNSHVGNIYKGKVVNVESGIQAAFIDFGINRNGFLHVSDLHPRYFPGKKGKNNEKIGSRKALKERIPIQKCLKNGDELLVQVTKEGVSTKGPTLSSYISLPGKFLVMMPWMKKQGISQKIEDEEERQRLKDILEQVRPRKGETGFIIRTAGKGATKREIQNDMKYLNRLWKTISKRIKSEKAPCGLYRESDLVTRTLRDVYTSKVKKIICDSEPVTKKIRDFLSLAMPRYKNRASYYGGKEPLFHKYNIEDEIDKIQSRVVYLKNGGSLVIEQTEALVAIDVNSGKYRKQKSAEQTAYKMNLDAAKEIVRQLRLRDLGGLIVCDFIDMRHEKHRRQLEKEFRKAAKADRARSKILRLSRFGILEMTRQRMRPSLQSSTYLACPNCGGTGYVKSYESTAIEIIRKLNYAVSKDEVKTTEFYVSPAVANYLNNQKRATIAQIEQNNDKRIIIRAETGYTNGQTELHCYNQRGSVVKI